MAWRVPFVVGEREGVLLVVATCSLKAAQWALAEVFDVLQANHSLWRDGVPKVSIWLPVPAATEA